MILENPKKLVTKTVISEVGTAIDEDFSESSSFLPQSRAYSYSSTYEAEINALEITKSQVEHDSYYLTPSSESHRHLGPFSIALIMISKMFGSGIFATPAIIYQGCNGSPVLFFACWIISLVVAFGGMRIYLELSTLIDKNGGLKTYLQFLYYRPKMLMNCIVSILNIIFGYAVTNSIIFSQYSYALVDYTPTLPQVNCLALALILFGTILYGFSVKHAIKLQNVLGGLKVILLLIMVSTSVFVLLPSSWTKVTYNNNLKFDSSFWEIHDFELSKFTSLVLKAVFTLGGYDSVSILTGEVVNPKKTLRKVCPIMIFVMALSFITINFAYLTAIPREELMESNELVGALLFSKIFGESFGSKFMILSVAFSCLGNVLISIYGFGRIDQEAFREGFLPFSQFFASNWPHDAPLPALFVEFTISALILILSPSNDLFDFIVNLGSYPQNFFSLLLGLGVFVLRAKYSYLKHNIKAPLWSTVIFCLMMLFLMLAPLVSPNGDNVYAYCGAISLLGGVLYWYCYFKLAPWWGRYDLVELEIVLTNGTVMKKWERLHY